MSDKIVFGDVVRRFLSEFIATYTPISWVKKVLTNLSECGTEAMGIGSYYCWDCGHEASFNLSCRNRHCPSCHTHRKEQWLEARMGELLPVQYFHVVFTIPDILHPAMMGNMEKGYNALFKAAKETLQKFGDNLNVQLGMTMVLHTWGSNLSYHPHLHVLVPGGGIDRKTGKWIDIQPDASVPNPNDLTEECLDSVSDDGDEGKQPFLFPVQALSKVFRAKFIHHLTTSCGRDVLDRNIREECFQRAFVVFAKAPAAGPEQVLEYLARYSYGIAISNSRLEELSEDEVTFRYKDYRDGGKSKIMCLKGMEFLRRFSTHILPKGFTRIRHCGFLSPCNREKLSNVQQELNNLPESTLLTPRKKEIISQKHAPCCERCLSWDIFIQISYKKKCSEAAIRTRIRSPAPSKIAV